MRMVSFLPFILLVQIKPFFSTGLFTNYEQLIISLKAYEILKHYN